MPRDTPPVADWDGRLPGWWVGSRLPGGHTVGAGGAMLGQLVQRSWVLLRRASRQWSEHGDSLMAAAISYYAALSFFPLLMILTAILGVFLRTSGWGQNAQARLLEMIANQTSGSLATQVEAALNEVQLRAAISGPVGVVTLLLAAMAIFVNLERALDRIWGTRQSRPTGAWASVRHVLRNRLLAFLMLLGIGTLVLVTFAAGMVVASMSALGDDYLPGVAALWSLLQSAVGVLLDWALFAAVYKVLPPASVPWRAAAWGGLFASIVWELGRLALAAFVIGEKYDAYGVIGSFIAIMLWVYYATAVLFMGAEVTQILSVSTGED